MQASLGRAKYEKNIELDLLLRLSLVKFLTQEIGNQFANLVLEGKEWIRHRGTAYECTEQAHVVKARLAELQADRRNIFRQVGQQVYQMLMEVEENTLAKSRRALFGEEPAECYDLLKNRLVFVEGGKDDTLYLEQYVLLGNYSRDQDRMETIDALLLDFLREFVLAGDHGEEMSEAWKSHNTQVDAALSTRGELARLEEEREGLLRRMERGEGLLSRVGWHANPATLRAALADAENRHKHLQQKLEELGPRLEAAKQKAEFLTEQYQSRLADYLNQPENARRLFDPNWPGQEAGVGSETRAPLREERIRRPGPRDLRDYQRLAAGVERINLIRSERTRELSRLNNSLYEFLLPEESQPAEDRVVSHAVIKADVRGSTKITEDLFARGLNPASHLSLNLYEPVKRILERYGAAKVFIEGDAIVLAIFETESNRSRQRAVAKACLLAREILPVSQAYNDRAQASNLPRLELGLGIAYQHSPPTSWMDSDSRIMISKALNLSDRLSGCSKVARRLLAQNPSLFKLFLFQTMMEGAAEEEADEFLIRFNMNGVELNEEGFAKLSEEISLGSTEAECLMPWGRERTSFHFGEVPIGDSLEPIVIRKGFVRQLLPDGKIGAPGTRTYYEVCTSA